MHPAAHVKRACALLATLCACTVSNSNGNGTGTAFLTNGIDRLHDAICTYRERCAGVPIDRELCRAELEAQTSTFGTAQAIVEEIQRGRIRLVDSEADDCVNAVTNLGCFPFREDPLAIPACDAAFVGLAQQDDECETDFSCVTGFACTPTLVGGTCLGLCSRLAAGACVRDADCPSGSVCSLDGRCLTTGVPQGLDEPCGTFSGCAPGLECLQVNPTDFRCLPLGVSGTSCSTLGGRTCGEGLFCITRPGATEGTCLASAGLGQGCVDPLQCGGPLSPLVCDPASGVCVERPRSGACFPVNGLALCDPTTSFCDPTTLPPTCRPLRPLGFACASDLECASPLVCRGGLCSNALDPRCVPGVN